MVDIRTYNDVKRLSKCMTLRNYIPDLTDETIEEVYYFLNENSHNMVVVSPEMISYIDSYGKTAYATVLDMITAAEFERIVVSEADFSITFPQYKRGTNASGGGSGCSGCTSGRSSNNNNNNNNNNG